MKHLFLILCALTLFALPACEEQSADTQDATTSAQETGTTEATAPATPEIELRGIYSYATTPSQKNGAIFLDIVNTSDIDDKLIGVEISHAAQKVELHETNMEDGNVMKMRQVDAIEIPAQSTVSLEPSGKHIMLMGLQNDLESGKSFFVTLTFEKAGRVASVSKIIAAGSTPEE